MKETCKKITIRTILVLNKLMFTNKRIGCMYKAELQRQECFNIKYLLCFV
jgi:hypothetical protein